MGESKHGGGVWSDKVSGLLLVQFLCYTVDKSVHTLMHKFTHMIYHTHRHRYTKLSLNLNQFLVHSNSLSL